MGQPRPDEWPMLARPALAAAIMAGLTALPRRAQFVTGVAGVGKTTLVAQVAEASSLQVVPVIALAELSGVPLGAFAPALAQQGLPTQPERAVPAIMVALGRQAQRHLLLIDDAPRLDDVSAAAVYQLVRAFGIPTLATARSGERMPAPLEQLSDEGMISRHELGGFDSEEVGSLLAMRFGRRARHEDVQRITRRTDGNALYLRMIVEAAERAGKVRLDGDLVAVDDVDAPAGLVDAVVSRLEELGPEERRLLHLAVLLQPVERPVLAANPSESGPVARLEARGLLAAEPGGSRLRVTHPLIAESVQHSAFAGPEAAEAARRLRALGTPQDRFLAIQIDNKTVGAAVDARDLDWGCRYAFGVGDFHQAIELAEALLAAQSDQEQRFVATVTRASAWSQLGEAGAAERGFAAAETLAQHPNDRLLLATRRGDHLAYRRFDLKGAFAQAERIRAQIDGEEAEILDGYLEQWRTMLGVMSGMPRLGRLAFRFKPEFTTRAAVLVIISRSLRGDKAGVREAIAELSRIQGEIGQVDPAASAALGFQQFVELICAGRVAEAADHLEAKRTDAGAGVGLYTCLLANLRQCGGQLAEAERLASLAVDQLRWRDGMGFLGVALAYQANIAAKLGRYAQARTILDSMSFGQRIAPGAAIPRAEAQAWILAGEGDPDRAVAVVERAAIKGAASGYPFVAALAMCVVIRLGHVARAAAVLEDICASLPDDLELCLAIRDLAVALRDKDLKTLPLVLARVIACGQEPTVIDAVALALRMRPTPEIRRKLELIAATVAHRVDEPPVQGRRADLLTPRELEVALAAAGRERSREIAARLEVSPRTVESQLQSVFRKLGVNSRDELGAALAEADLTEGKTAATS